MNWKQYTSKLLDKSGLSQAQLAHKTGIGQASISELVTGMTGEPRFTVRYALVSFGKKIGLDAPTIIHPTPKS